MSVSLQELSTAPLDETYERLDSLGEGGFGVVYKARQKGTGQLVAIKMMKSERLEKATAKVRDEMRSRFWREVQLIGRLRSPYSVRLMGAGVDDDQPYMVIEFVEGRSLKDVLEDGALRPELVLRLMRQLLEALAEAHEQGIVHRDLKPDNIMIMGKGRRLTAKVLDFGIAGIVDEFRDDSAAKVTEFGQIRGTPQYMAPEQILFFGEPMLESDIYSVGLILLECLMGEPAVQGETGSEICRRQINEPIEVPVELLRTGFGPVIERACSKDPEERYRSADEMLTALEAVDLHRASVQISTMLEERHGPDSDQAHFNRIDISVNDGEAVSGVAHTEALDLDTASDEEASSTRRSPQPAPAPWRGPVLVVVAVVVIAAAVYAGLMASSGAPEGDTPVDQTPTAPPLA